VIGQQEIRKLRRSMIFKEKMTPDLLISCSILLIYCWRHPSG
jgi:hypothetical protein